MHAAHCAICLNHFALDADKPEFLIFPCGHGFCSICTDQLFAQRRTTCPTCPTCRTGIRKAEGHPVYLELVDQNTVYARTVIDGLDQMGPNTPLGSVQKASHKIQKVIAAPPQDSATTLSAILKALEEFNTRIIPCFESIDRHKREIQALQHDLEKSHKDKQALESRLMDTEILKSENTRLNHKISKIRAERETALRLAEQARDEMQKTLSRAEGHKTKMDELELENNNFRKTIERHRHKAHAQKAKYAEIVKERDALRERRRVKETQSQDMSDSMRDYDGDHSSHENSLIHNIQQTLASSQSRSNRRAYPDENEIQLDWEGMPPPTFGSDWQLNGSIRAAKKRAVHGITVESQRRVANTFPISLDHQGRPTRPVQLGPRTTLQIVKR